jgi:hypothetical protein
MANVLCLAYCAVLYLAFYVVPLLAYYVERLLAFPAFIGACRPDGERKHAGALPLNATSTSIVGIMTITAMMMTIANTTINNNSTTKNANTNANNAGANAAMQPVCRPTRCGDCRPALFVGARKSRYNQNRFISTADALVRTRPDLEI